MKEYLFLEIHNPVTAKDLKEGAMSNSLRRWNYGHYGKMVGVDLVNNPELAADPDVAAKIAIAYWNDRVDRKAARNGDVLTVTKNINGGTNGLEDRERRFDLYMKGQTPSGDVKVEVVRVHQRQLNLHQRQLNLHHLKQLQVLQNHLYSHIAKEKEGTPNASFHSTGPSTSDLTVPSMTGGSLPIVSPKVKPSSRSNIQPPKSRTGSGGIIPVAIPGQQQPTSSSGGNQTEAPMFPSTDQNNPELLVVKSIYNIVG